MIEKKMICISCPIGCRLTVTRNDGGEVSVTGNRCNRGEEYGREELLAPKRTVTATAACGSTTIHRLPVKTDKPLPVEYIDELLNRVYTLQIDPPVSIGRTIISNIRDTGVNLVATRSVAS